MHCDGPHLPPISITTCFLPHSAANVKKWEIELQTLRESNARLTTALQESAASVEQWKKQFSICRDENDRLRNKVGLLEQQPAGERACWLERAAGGGAAVVLSPLLLSPPRGRRKTCCLLPLNILHPTAFLSRNLGNVNYFYQTKFYNSDIKEKINELVTAALSYSKSSL